MLNKTFLKCSKCHKQLTSYEEDKYQRLMDYWGGRKPFKPYCKACYWENLEIAKRKAIIL